MGAVEQCVCIQKYKPAMSSLGGECDKPADTPYRAAYGLIHSRLKHCSLTTVAQATELLLHHDAAVNLFAIQQHEFPEL